MNNRVIEKLNRAKKQKGITLKQLAEQSGLPQGTVNKIMSGSQRDIKTDKLLKIAAALDLPAEQLFEASQTAQQNTDDNERKSPCLGIVKIVCVSPEVRVGDCRFNAEKIAEAAKQAAADGAKLVVFPELSISGYSCGDLFFQNTLRQAALQSLQWLCSELRSVKAVVAVGLPICDKSAKLFNAAAILFGGKILGIVPKTHLPNYNEFAEKRAFTPADDTISSIRMGENEIPFGTKLLFENTLLPEMTFAVEICEDIWVADSPSLQHAAAGANLLLNLSASNEIVCKAAYRKKLVEIQSAKTCAVYAYCSSGASESTSNVVFSAHNIICENGQVVAESQPFGSGYAVAEADLNFIVNERSKMQHENFDGNYLRIGFELPIDAAPTRVYDPMPFVPKDKAELWDRCETILNLQAHALKQRLSHVKAQTAVLGVSGGTDSTLALLVCKRAMDLLCRPTTDILCVTMPCFGTTQRTLNNSVALAEALGATVKKIDISASVTQHLKDIGHDGRHDTTFENAQARERTQVLMDIANQTNGLVVGTGDLSEGALGWSTFNGDQMSMYAVNGSVPKTMVKALIAHEAEKSRGDLKKILNDVLATPVSPELLPPQNGEIAQVTEDIVGPYELHDYFLYMLIRKGFAPSKVFCLAKLSFKGKYDAQTICTWLEKFVKRFFAQQFKRSCQPDSVKVGTVDLSKYNWRMPSDAYCEEWLADLQSVAPKCRQDKTKQTTGELSNDKR